MLAFVCNFFAEPMCAVGFGVCGFFSTADRQSNAWPFIDYSLTAVSVIIYSLCITAIVYRSVANLSVCK